MLVGIVSLRAGQKTKVHARAREAKTVASLNHPNIVTFYSVEEEAGVRFLTSPAPPS